MKRIRRYKDTKYKTVRPNSQRHKEFLDKYILGQSHKWVVDDKIYSILANHINEWIDNNPNKNPNEDNKLKGDLGEIFVREQLRKQLQEHGFKWTNRALKPMTYQMYYQYPKGKGIDIYLRAMDEEEYIHKVYFEVKNWCKWSHMNFYAYFTKCEKIFFRFDSEGNASHIIAINRRNVSLLEKRMKESERNTIVLPLREHYTVEFLRTIEEKHMITKRYIKEFLREVETNG